MEKTLCFPKDKVSSNGKILQLGSPINSPVLNYQIENVTSAYHWFDKFKGSVIVLVKCIKMTAKYFIKCGRQYICLISMFHYSIDQKLGVSLKDGSINYGSCSS